MRFTCTEQVELPFMLNLPSGDYEVDIGGTGYVLEVHQQYVAVHFGARQFAVGDPAWLKSQLGQSYDQAFKQPLRTVVKHVSVVEIEETELPAVSDSDALEDVQAAIIGESPMQYSGKTDDLKAEAQRRIDELSPEDKAQLLLRSAKVRAARKTPNAECFISALNSLIRLYMQIFNDFFVEEVTLHQLAAQSPLAGVFVTLECDGEDLHHYGHIGKVPPLMRKPWLSHPQGQIDGFKESLKRGVTADSVVLLEVRARGFLETGATRSAIIEGSAALDLSVARKLREGFARQGMSVTDIDDTLKAEIHFKSRANKLMRQAHGKGLSDIDNALYTTVLTHRNTYRHGIAHSDVEPTTQEATQVVQDFVSLRKVVDAI